jgi:hypothetical protein
MIDTMTRYLAAVKERAWSWGLRKILEPVVDRFSSQPLTSAGLVISTGGATVAKIGAADFYASVQGKLVKVAAGTAMPALTGIGIPAGQYGVALFFVDSGGNVTVAQGTPGATLGAVAFPQLTKEQALIGFLIITYASAFVGGTTPLDTATTVYVSPLGAFDPTVLI